MTTSDRHTLSQTFRTTLTAFGPKGTDLRGKESEIRNRLQRALSQYSCKVLDVYFKEQELLSPKHVQLVMVWACAVVSCGTKGFRLKADWGQIAYDWRSFGAVHISVSAG